MTLFKRIGKPFIFSHLQNYFRISVKIKLIDIASFLFGCYYFMFLETQFNLFISGTCKFLNNILTKFYVDSFINCVFFCESRKSYKFMRKISLWSFAIINASFNNFLYQSEEISSVVPRWLITILGPHLRILGPH